MNLIMIQRFISWIWSQQRFESSVKMTVIACNRTQKKKRFTSGETMFVQCPMSIFVKWLCQWTSLIYLRESIPNISLSFDFLFRFNFHLFGSDSACSCYFVNRLTLTATKPMISNHNCNKTHPLYEDIGHCRCT